MKRSLLLGALVCGLGMFSSAVQGQVANLKVVTDANPDYSDMESMVHSITSRWKTDEEKMWALFYWDHIGRRHAAALPL